MRHTPPRRADPEIWRERPIFLAGDSALAKAVGRPIAEFLRVESASGVLLLAAAVVAMVWANSPWSDSYASLWHAEITLDVGPWQLSESLQHWVNDGLMVFFFFVVGLEVKYELVAGHLRDPKAAALPVVAALGGMVVPALIYTVIVSGGQGSHGWGIPMATDIAFAVGVLALLGPRVSTAARVFLLTLAIADDIGAIMVIAFFYTTDLSGAWLGGAAACFVAIVVLRRLRVWSLPVYVVIGVVAWLCMYQSGVHATIAGVILGLLTPARPLLQESVARHYAGRAIADRHLDVEELSRLRFLLGESVPVVARLQDRLHPFSSYVVLPIFALANAGITLGGGHLADALSSKVTLGVAAGLVLGKIIGITGASWLAVRLGIGRLPAHTGWPVVAGLGMVGGIGFTVALFVTGLAFPGQPTLTDDAKVGILGASVLAAILGVVILLAATSKPRPGRDEDERPPESGDGSGGSAPEPAG